MGYSMGAVTAIAAAARAGRAVAAVIADSPYRYPAQVIARTLTLHGLPGRTLATVAWAMLGWRWRTLQGVDAAKLAGELRPPLLVLHGSDDVIAPATESHQIAEAACDGRLVVFDNADHLAAAFEQPEPYIAELRGFVAQLLQSK